MLKPWIGPGIARAGVVLFAHVIGPPRGVGDVCDQVLVLTCSAFDARTPVSGNIYLEFVTKTARFIISTCPVASPELCRGANHQASLSVANVTFVACAAEPAVGVCASTVCRIAVVSASSTLVHIDARGAIDFPATAAGTLCSTISRLVASRVRTARWTVYTFTVGNMLVFCTGFIARASAKVTCDRTCRRVGRVFKRAGMQVRADAAAVGASSIAGHFRRENHVHGRVPDAV